jgi:predicted RNase H-like HicB family nuclease
VRRDRDTYVAECLEIRVVTQGKTLDEVFSNLKEAITLYLEGEDLERLGLSPGRLVVTCELWFADGPGG